MVWKLKKGNLGASVSRGLTLIELLVVISIFALISLVILANHSRFNSSVLLGSLGYDIALSMREAQVYGLSVKQYANNFQVGYGVRFSGTSSYTFFADTNANKVYDSGTDAIVQVYSIGQGHFISRFCGVRASGAEECSNSPSPIDHLDIVFFRPDPDANISSNIVGPYSRAKIVVGSPSGETRTVTIESTGQVSVTNP
jgi:prepilin-type N-terminal cleavage/methylation domain-containing protein